jgi:2,4-dienoyl-CoA reductase-like NADH-dependent reductase (Old Yellow Enzyme family)
MSADTLFSPWERGPVRSANRLLVAPMTRVSANADGSPNATMARYYARFAQGGFGIVISEGIYTDQAYAQGYRNQPGLSSDEQAQAWRPVTNAVHAAGGRIYAQLMHAGALAQDNPFRDVAAGPSAVRPCGEQMPAYHGEGPYRVPVALSGADIDAAIAGFAEAARRAITTAGFDGIEIHGANGYLIDQFLNSHTNLREDSFGGSIANRTRFATSVIHAVRMAVGADVPVGLRISQAKVNDAHYTWPGRGQEAQEIFATFGACSLDYLHLTQFEAWQPAFPEGGPSLVELARAAAPRLTIVANGSLDNPVRARAILAQGADLVALGRGALANPDWPHRAAHRDQMRPFDYGILQPIAHIKPCELDDFASVVPAQPASA